MNASMLWFLTAQERGKGNVSQKAFRKITDPGQGDPAITRLGFDIRQSISGWDTYTYTAFDNDRVVELAWLNVSSDKMTITFRRDVKRHEIDASELPGIVAELIAEYPNFGHPRRAVEAIDAIGNDISFDGKPGDGVDDDSYGLQPEN